MVKQLGHGCVSVTVKELGTNCWLAKRFCQNGSRCDRVYCCNYPEKKKCQAVHAEIAYLEHEKNRLIVVSMNLDMRVQELAAMLEK